MRVASTLPGVTVPMMNMTLHIIVSTNSVMVSEGGRGEGPGVGGGEESLKWAEEREPMGGMGSSSGLGRRGPRSGLWIGSRS